jgi:ribosomal protein S18 acetylase RimI-like enzyme
MTLREAGRGDAPAMARVLVHTWRERYRGLVDADVLDGLDENGFARYFEQALAPGSGHGALLAGSEPAGFIHFGPEEGAESHGHIFSFYVLPRWSGRGVGRELLAGAIAELAEQGFRTITLWVFKDNAATVRIYERAGFRPDGAERVEPEYRLPEQRMALRLP